MPHSGALLRAAALGQCAKPKATELSAKTRFWIWGKEGAQLLPPQQVGCTGWLTSNWAVGKTPPEAVGGGMGGLLPTEVLEHVPPTPASEAEQRGRAPSGLGARGQGPGVSVVFLLARTGHVLVEALCAFPASRVRKNHRCHLPGERPQKWRLSKAFLGTQAATAPWVGPWAQEGLRPSRLRQPRARPGSQQPPQADGQVSPVGFGTHRCFQEGTGSRDAATGQTRSRTGGLARLWALGPQGLAWLQRGKGCEGVYAAGSQGMEAGGQEGQHWGCLSETGPGPAPVPARGKGASYMAGRDVASGPPSGPWPVPGAPLPPGGFRTLEARRCGITVVFIGCDSTR